MQIILEIRLKVPLNPMSLRITTYQLAIKHSAIFGVAGDVRLVHVRKCVSCTVRSRVTKREHSLCAARICRLIQMTMLEGDAKLKVMFSTRPNGIVFESSGSTPIKIVEPCRCRPTKWQPAANGHTRDQRIAGICRKQRRGS